MAGIMYLGNQMVSPVVLKAIQKEIPSYEVVDGVAKKRSRVLEGNEFRGINSVDDNGLAYSFYKCNDITGHLDLSSIKSVGIQGLYYAFNSTGITSVDLSSLESAGHYSFHYAFMGSPVSGDIDLSSIKTVGMNAFSYAFVNCKGITSVDLSSLESIDDSGLYDAFGRSSVSGDIDLSSLKTVGSRGFNFVFLECSRITSIDLSSLESIGYSCFYGAFEYCTDLRDIYFNSLKTTSFGNYNNQFDGMLNRTGTEVMHTLHFPSNLESTIQGLSSYPNFGGTSGYVVLAFDLPSTEVE